MPQQSPKEDEGDSKRFWQNKGDERSQFIFVSFVAVILIMLVVMLSTGAYGYYSWQEWKRGPQIRVDEGLFEFNNNETNEGADITIHLTLINQGERGSGSITLEWLIMERVEANDNIIFDNGNILIPSMNPETSRKETFDVSLPQGEFVLAYRVYDDQLFSYEARQNLIVRADDVSSGSPETVSVPEFSMILVPVVAIITMFIILRSWYHKR